MMRLVFGRCGWDRPAPAEFPRRSPTWYLKRAHLAHEKIRAGSGGEPIADLLARTAVPPER